MVEALPLYQVHTKCAGPHLMQYILVAFDQRMCSECSLGLFCLIYQGFGLQFRAKVQAKVFFLDTICKGGCYATSFTLSEKLWLPLITPVPRLKHLPICLSGLDCESSPLSVSSFSEDNHSRSDCWYYGSYSVPPDYSYNCFSTDF